MSSMKSASKTSIWQSITVLLIQDYFHYSTNLIPNIWASWLTVISHFILTNLCLSTMRATSSHIPCFWWKVPHSSHCPAGSSLIRTILFSREIRLDHVFQSISDLFWLLMMAISFLGSTCPLWWSCPFGMSCSFLEKSLALSHLSSHFTPKRHFFTTYSVKRSTFIGKSTW